MASDGGTRENLAFRVRFAHPDGRGRQQVQVLRAEGASARRGSDGLLLGEGATGAVFPLGTGGMAWAGQAADPFTADGIALAVFLQGLAEGKYRPEVFTASPANVFAGRDVTAIALQLPDGALGGARSRRGPGSASSAMPRSSR